VREREMVAVARRVFTERGYAAASMDEIARAAQITKPMLYAYFSSKEGLFAECVREAGIELRAAVRAAAGSAADLPPDRRLWAGLLAVFTGIEQTREAWDLLYPLEGQGPGGALGARAAYGMSAMTELVEELMAEAARARGLTEEALVHIAPLAEALTGAVVALINWWRRNPHEPKELHAARAMNLTWRGLEQLLEGQVWVPPAAGGR